MSKFLIEVPHDSDKAACARAIHVFHATGSHFVANADWGCDDGEHKDGTIKWQGRRVYINENLAGEWLALEEIAEGVSELRYGPITLGHLTPKGNKLIRNAAGRGLVDNAEALPTTPPPQPPHHHENIR